MSSEVPIPEEAIERMVPLLTHVMTEGDAEDAAWDLARAAAPLIVAAAYEQLANEIGQHGAAGHASAGDNHTAAMAGVTELSMAAWIRRRASVLRGEGQTHG